MPKSNQPIALLLFCSILASNPIHADDYSKLDSVIQNIVELTVPQFEERQVTSVSNNISRAEEQPVEEKEDETPGELRQFASVLTQNFWGVDLDEQNAFDLRFTQSDNSKSEGQITVYERETMDSGGVPLVLDEEFEDGTWTLQSSGVVEIDIESRGESRYELDSGKQRSVLTRIAGGSEWPRKLDQRIIEKNAMGRHGRNRF